MKKPSTAWQRLVVAARQAPPTGSEAAPFGFSTRMAALALAAERPSLQSALNHFSWRALGLSLMIMVVSIATNYSSVTSVVEADHEAADYDPVEEVLLNLS